MSFPTLCSSIYHNRKEVTLPELGPIESFCTSCGRRNDRRVSIAGMPLAYYGVPRLFQHEPSGAVLLMAPMTTASEAIVMTVLSKTDGSVIERKRIEIADCHLWLAVDAEGNYLRL